MTQTGGTNTANFVTIADGGLPFSNSSTRGSYDLAGGTLNAQGIQNGQNGTFTLEGGATANIGSVGLLNGGQLQIRGKGGTINGDVTNTGTVTTRATNVTFNGTFTNSGNFSSQQSTQRFGTLVNTATGSMQGLFGDRFVVTGDFLNHSTQATTWSTAQSVLEFAASGGTSHSHTLLLNGANLGIGQAGYLNNFAWGTLQIDAGESLILGDGRTGSLALAAAFDTAAPAALYVQDLLGAIISGDEVTNITGDGLDIYYDPFLNANAYLGGLDYALEGGGELIADETAPPLPEPGTLALLTPGLGLVFLRRRRAMSTGAK
jgi:hypothetical protein